ncbi:hypothetical protein DVG78_29265 [Runella aurantiaca]|uniref:Uncharacterized protein n=1 Tax=Runella aurantiaca TaxID=2282308 RepID=A0A369I288_9BACT|nr:hypothetical protein DVG78_29265 [Runella aurantiaca]
MLRNWPVVFTSKERIIIRYQKYILYTNKEIQVTNTKNIMAELLPREYPYIARPTLIFFLLKLTR